MYNVPFIFHIPENFFDKIKNEPFIKKVMTHVLNIDSWTKGNPEKQEPDYFGKGVPFEFTIVSNQDKKNNFIQSIRNGTFSSDDIEQTIYDYIIDRIEAKAKKVYSTTGIHLCLLWLMPEFFWTLDYYGSVIAPLFENRKKQFFNEVKKKYIDSQKFSNIFLLAPDMATKWWVFDFKTGKKDYYQGDVKDLEYPYCIIK